MGGLPGTKRVTFLIGEDTEPISLPAEIYEISGRGSFALGAAQGLPLKLAPASRAFLQCPYGSGHAEIIGKGTFQAQPFFFKSPNLSWEMGVNLGQLCFKQGVTPYPAPVGVFAQAIRVTFTSCIRTFPHCLIASPDALQTTFSVCFNGA
jgi:hypothetical protein